MTVRNLVSVARRRGLRAAAGGTVWALRGKVARRRGKRFITKRVLGRPMLIDLDDQGISRTLLLFGTREAEHVEVLRRIVRPGMTVLDIGANIGFYALEELDLVGPGGEVILVEPSPQNVDLLRRNLALNGHEDVVVHAVAVSDRVGTRAFHLSTMSNLGTFHDVGTGVAHLSGEDIEVEITTVPEIAGGRTIDVIRMDVEGHEVEVLSGLAPAVEAGTLRPAILFETHFSRYGDDHDIVAVLRRLFAAGYRVATVGSSSERGTELIEAKGYRGEPPIRTDDVRRVLFHDIAEDDFIELLTVTGGIRTVLLTNDGAP